VLPQAELMGSIAKDGLIPAIFARTDAKGTYVFSSWACGVGMILIAACVPFDVIWNMISLGVLLGFNLTNTSLIMVRYGNGGQVRAPKLWRWLAALWISAALGGYSFWQGFAAPALEGEPWDGRVLALSLIAMAFAFVMMVGISRQPQFEEETPKDGASRFYAPAVPFVPGVALILNFALMSTMSWWDHLYLGIFIVGILALYFSRSSSPASEAPKVESEPQQETCGGK